MDKIQEIQERFMQDKNSITQDEAIELLAGMYDDKYEISPNMIRRFLNIPESDNGI